MKFLGKLVLMIPEYSSAMQVGMQCIYAAIDDAAVSPLGLQRGANAAAYSENLRNIILSCVIFHMHSDH